MANKSSNKNLRKASKEKNDEFYTQLVDIEKELKYYKEQFRGKVVYCNCDDPYESNFFKYFAANFNSLGLKKLITTTFDGSPVADQQLLFKDMEGLKPNGKEPLKIEINNVPDANKDGAVDLSDVELLLKHEKNSSAPLKKDGHGDFRSDECIALLKQADIVVTNPPFSLFREYVAQLMEYKKKFIIIGNKNAITYKEIFKCIKENKMWLGYRNINSDMWLMVPEGEKYEKIVDGVKLKHIMACWYTNLDTLKRHEEFIMYKKYTPEEYPTYDNYDAINVNVVAEIPKDFDGVMGVPITFLDKYSPEQFELLGIMNTGEENKGIRHKGTPHGRPLVNGVEKYLRILIKNKK